MLGSINASPAGDARGVTPLLASPAGATDDGGGGGGAVAIPHTASSNGITLSPIDGATDGGERWGAASGLPCLRTSSGNGADLVDDDAPPPVELRLSWRDVSLRVKGNRILAPSSGVIGGGLWCLIGPSGAGKSSLLGILSGRKEGGRQGGEVLLNGARAAAASRRSLIGYVTQADVLPGTSSVRELLHFHASLRLPRAPADARARLVLSVLDRLQLRAKADARIGDAYVRGLSGGERRRVSVAIELMVMEATTPPSPPPPTARASAAAAAAAAAVSS